MIYPPSSLRLEDFQMRTIFSALEILCFVARTCNIHYCGLVNGLHPHNYPLIIHDVPNAAKKNRFCGQTLRGLRILTSTMVMVNSVGGWMYSVTYHGQPHIIHHRAR
jgi:hypothetical protein